MAFAHWISDNARRHPDKIALRFGAQQLSYAALAAHCDEVAAALTAAGVERGGCVAWLGLNSPQLLATLFACARIGAVFMPLNWRLAPPEHAAVLQEVAPALLCADTEFAAAIASPGTRCVALGSAPEGWMAWSDFLAEAGAQAAADVGPCTVAGGGPHTVAGADTVAAAAVLPDRRADAAADPQAPLLLCFTSGSTGRPKGVLLSADALAANADASVDMHDMRADDRVLTTLPLFHVGGLNIQTTPALRLGCTVTLLPRFDADATFVAIERERITLTVLVPAQLDALIAHPRWAGAPLFVP